MRERMKAKEKIHQACFLCVSVCVYASECGRKKRVTGRQKGNKIKELQTDRATPEWEGEGGAVCPPHHRPLS